mmetsp:Transcript_31147/g.54756  ORF Transcript_31147/g.54756 Transcript_31147/m.54756 type:complete len:184 (-) Transcript_31147:174-725(-)|eukprot:CAMPEP_0197519070 /NCGR_PEP_ID=MMETSP1318-20131121/4319_1 /TAXON_ID=552666 /ORGANISM="Partenskyella glossopodia, Strain RCC365" /LENGTH=183 /DNA_ID=CAMNT_0043069835 /DNA_START=182 /DNA_END=733 /DNA_ORIENTATION=+
MGLLFSSLWSKIFASSKKYKICMLGLDNAGKTTILFKLHLGEVVETQPTIGSNVEEIKVNNLRFVCWDLGGQTTLRKNWADYFTNTSAVIMVVDSCDRKRIDEVKKEFYKVLGDPNLKNACFLVLANKQDCENKMEAAEIAQKLDLLALKTHSWHIQATCALTGAGLSEGMDWISHQITKTGV